MNGFIFHTFYPPSEFGSRVIDNIGRRRARRCGRMDDSQSNAPDALEWLMWDEPSIDIEKVDRHTRLLRQS